MYLMMRKVNSPAMRIEKMERLFKKAIRNPPKIMQLVKQERRRISNKFYKKYPGQMFKKRIQKIIYLQICI